MTTTHKLVELFRAIATEDMNAIAVLATELCEHEENKGHRTVARMLRGALNANGKRLSSNGHERLTPITESQNVLSAALTRLTEPKMLADVVLTPSVRSELESVVAEWKHRAALLKRGIPPRSKLLFHGPPGCGKSLTAQALGYELGLPVYMVRFDAVIGAFLGQTAIHLRQLFHFAETTPCVLLLDELDALGKKRGSPLDVGELDRIVISLLQELEHSKPLGVVIGTSNLPQRLDDALWRRFDLDVFLKAPTQAMLRAFVKQLADRKNITLRAGVSKRAVAAPSFAAAEGIVIAEVRRQTLQSFGEK